MLSNDFNWLFKPLYGARLCFRFLVVGEAEPMDDDGTVFG